MPLKAWGWEDIICILGGRMYVDWIRMILMCIWRGMGMTMEKGMGIAMVMEKDTGIVTAMKRGMSTVVAMVMEKGMSTAMIMEKGMSKAMVMEKAMGTAIPTKNRMTMPTIITQKPRPVFTTNGKSISMYIPMKKPIIIRILTPIPMRTPTVIPMLISTGTVIPMFTEICLTYIRLLTDWIPMTA